MKQSNTDTDDCSQRNLWTVFSHDDRGIAFTIDALLTSLLLFTAIAIAMSQMPESAGQEAQESFSKSQVKQDASDMLSVTRETGELKDATTYWDDSNAEWLDSGSGGTYVSPPTGHPLETPLNNFYVPRGGGFNINVVYQETSGASATKRVFYQGTPGPNAVITSQTLILRDDDTIPDGTELEDTTAFYAGDVFPGSNRYNIIRVQVIMWN